MTISRRHLTRALMIAALATGAWTATEMADNTAAHAAGKPRPAAEQSRGLLDRAGRLPEQASERAREAIEDTTEPAPVETPEPPRDEPEPPVEQPTEDRPSTEPTPPAEPAPTTPTPTIPPVDVPPVVIDPPTTDPIEVDLPPIELPTPPVEKPRDEPPTQQPPLVITLPLPEQPAEPLRLPLAGAPLVPIPSDTAAVEAPVCEDPPAPPEPDYERGHVRRILDRITGLHRAKPTRPLKPCPGHDTPPDFTNAAGPAMKPPPGGIDLLAHTTTLAHPTPALLRHIWPRAHLPASRVTCVEPGPA